MGECGRMCNMKSKESLATTGTTLVIYRHILQSVVKNEYLVLFNNLLDSTS